MGGQSAFGTKAGDLFTKITIGLATFWIVLCIISVRVLGISGGGLLSQNLGNQPRSSAPAPTEKPSGGPQTPPPTAPPRAAK
jgi:preprotein translocase subunit SecG